MHVSGPADSGRLDQYLSQTLNLSRNLVKHAIIDLEITVNDKTAKPKTLVSETDTIFVPDALLEKQPEIGLVPQKYALDIMFEDAHIIVLNKSAGVLTHPTSSERTDTLVNYLMAHTTQLAQSSGINRPGIVHRLDKDTEGLMVVAKTDAAYNHLKDQFQERTIHKEYIAMVKGVMSKTSDTLTHYMSVQNGGNPPVKICHQNYKNAKEAITYYEVLKCYTNQTLVTLFPKTGRTHQIRVHMASIGHPVLGDYTYGPQKNASANGQRLQAYKLSFIHPIKEKRYTFILPISKRILKGSSER